MKRNVIFLLLAIMSTSVFSQNWQGTIRSHSWRPYGSESDDLFLDVKPGTRILRTRNWNSNSPNISVTGILTGKGYFEGRAKNGNYTTLLKLSTTDNGYHGSGGAIELCGLNSSGSHDPLGVIAGYLVNGTSNLQTGHLRFLTSNDGVLNEQLRITNAGFVGIGTTSPKYKLSVKGTIGCGELKVEDVSTWPDYVFENNYNLRSIEEVESYINENKHLPDIPSEKQVKEEGISVGEMNAKLLQKIEELTLYMIETNKQMKQLKEENKELRDLIENKL